MDDNILEEIHRLIKDLETENLALRRKLNPRSVREMRRIVRELQKRLTTYWQLIT